MSKAVNCSVLCLAVLSSMLQAQEQRWFEVEMVVFSQTPPQVLQETFGDTVTPIKPGRAFDLLTPRLQPNLLNLLATLPLCAETTSPLLTDKPFFNTLPKQLCIFETQPYSWQHNSLFYTIDAYSEVPYPDHLPALVTGNGKHQLNPYLAEQPSLQLTDIATKINRISGSHVLLHTSWRQAPVTERRAIASRWYAGKNFSQQFDYWGQIKQHTDVDNTETYPTPAISTIEPLSNDYVTSQAPGEQPNELLTNIEQLLEQLQVTGQLRETALSVADTPDSTDSMTLRYLPDQVWQLDGLFKLHLDHYLFVNTEFNLRIPDENSLQTVYVRQSRRVISGEIHYLDHPHLGIVLQIRRYEPPVEDNIESALPIQ
ncbi:CsiV family protein [Rheinheimera baltica]|uniref:CsiV family protein n=1 Tax=Rheinheimera baltica TaxID=67576 RepID=UPI00273DA082|nr:CsiV family protein [Rheinheimera baltica]MDP5189694.1 CsiV family protein [Rheinheimera baltica]